MKHLIFFFGSLILLFSSTYSQRPYWQQQVNYVIDVTLNDTAHTLDAFEKIEYINNSPDTLHFIWFHLWPNAFKNDKTAFSDQQVENGKTDFYFSDREDRGYINRLDFRIKGEVVRTEDHPQHIDIIKLVLPQPLAPGATVNIETPFHVKLPKNFSRGGHVGQSYHITQWFPKPAVYDRNGWHPMPYLDQGEFYSEFGNYDVRITVPSNYVVAATGDLQNEDEKTWLKTRGYVDSIAYTEVKESKNKKFLVKPKATKTVISSSSTKTLNYKQDQVVDFAWFADKEFLVSTDTIQLNGRTIEAYVFYFLGSVVFKPATQSIKDAIHFRSVQIGPYPFNTVSVVEAAMGFSGGMEYPTIASISPTLDERALDEVIEHEVGHNWFQGVLATNERDNPWMDEGINTYYDLRYIKQKYGATKRMGMLDEAHLMQRALDTWINWKLDQPITTSSENFSVINYGLIAYFKTADWLQEIESYVGREKFDEAMRGYFEEWKFKHPSPSDFKNTIEQKSGKDLSAFWKEADMKDSRPVFEKSRPLKFVPFFSLRDYKKKNYIGVFPAIGYNTYDQFMIGLGIHNYNLPSNKFQFILAPLYATNSEQLNGIGRMSYTWIPDKKVYRVEAGIAGSRFSTLKAIDSTDKKIFGGFNKLAPFVKLVFNTKNARDYKTWWLEAKTYLINEKQFEYTYSTIDSTFYPHETAYQGRYVNQLTVGVDNFRTLYPYEGRIQFQQGKDFYRANFTGNMFFNYAHGGGFNFRLFGAKFGYIGGKTSQKEFQTSIYQPKLTAVRGDEDYTYSNYFFGRNEHEGTGSKQIMMRDGDLKLRTDLFQGLQGRSDNWVSSINMNTTLPRIFPIKLPIRIFLDVGTYADAWGKESTTSKFLYVSGLQVSIFKELINIYAPILYSKEFKDQLKTVPEENTFWKRMSFSIDLQKINSRKYINQAQLY